jgi:Plasmid stabilization system protein
MIYKYIISPFAELDLDSIHEWYALHEQDLFIKFDKEFSACLKQIVENPLQFPVIYNKIRRALLKRFPYSIFFSIKGETVFILSVIHHKRNPKVWKQRKG